MRRRALSRGLATLALAAASAAAAAPALARDAVVRSFDGTPIVTHFHPASGGPAGPAPTVLVGPGWGFGGDTSPGADTSDVIGTATLRRAGYNVLTWDPRGFGGSGGTATFNAPGVEGRDVQALVDHVARQPEARLDGPGDPRVGMSGSSYGGAIQIVAAALDRRIDAIVPDIAYHSLTTSLFRNGAAKTGWLAAICGLGEATGLAPGLLSPAGIQLGSTDARLKRACVDGLATGGPSAADVAWLGERGLGPLAGAVRAPTLLVQGTVDTLVGLGEAIASHAAIGGAGTPVKMVWRCGGHGICQTGAGPGGHVQRAGLAWLDRWLKGDERVDTGPGFEWLADDAVWRSGPGYPLAAAGELPATGSGQLVLSPLTDPGVGVPTAATVAANAVNARFAVPPEPADVVGAPRLRLAYKGSALPARTYLYAQVVDARRGRVVGGQVTPVPVLLDGRTRTVQRDLEPIAVRGGPASDLRLQVAPGSAVFGPQRSAGGVRLDRIDAALPMVDATRGPAPRGRAASARRAPRAPVLRVRRLGGGRLAVRVRLRSRPCSGTVTFRARAGRLARARRARVSRRCTAAARLRLPAARGRRVRVSARYGGNATFAPRSARAVTVRLR